MRMHGGGLLLFPCNRKRRVEAAAAEISEENNVSELRWEVKMLVPIIIPVCETAETPSDKKINAY